MAKRKIKQNFSKKIPKMNHTEIQVQSLEEPELIAKTKLSIDLVTAQDESEFTALKSLENQDIIQSGSFECSICKDWVDPNDGVLLRECFHSFCKECLRRSIIENESMECIEKDCNSMLEHREIRGLLSKEEFEFFLDGTLKSYKNKKVPMQNGASEEFLKLLKLDNQDNVRCGTFNCSICSKWVEANDGVLIRQCFHQFCLECLRKHIGISTDPEIHCPNLKDKCFGILEQREIRGLVSAEDFDKFLLRSVHIIEDEVKFVSTEKTIEIDLTESEKQQPGCSKYLYANNESKTLPILIDHQIQQSKSLPIQNIIRTDSFNCPLCCIWVQNNEGIMLKQCLHTFCEKCLTKTVLNYIGPVIACPNSVEQCKSTLTRGEIQGLMTKEQFDEFLAKSLDSKTFENTELIRNVDYFRLLELEELDLVRYESEFECPICLNEIASGKGIILKNCLHIFCEDCLMETVRSCTGMHVECPFIDENLNGCHCHLNDCEIKYLLPLDEHTKFVERQLRLTEQILPTVHCAKTNCPGFEIIESSYIAYAFICAVCKSENCIRCKAIHTNMTCAEYENPEKYSSIKINALIESKEAMRCPKCAAIVAKVSGCDGMVCSICKTAICWATRGPRWGPGGVGDTSGGCRCKVNGLRCHPSCINCH